MHFFLDHFMPARRPAACQTILDVPNTDIFPPSQVPHKKDRVLAFLVPERFAAGVQSLYDLARPNYLFPEGTANTENCSARFQRVSINRLAGRLYLMGR
jgi:hypothetical protein